MKKHILKEVQQKWAEVGKFKTPEELDLKVEIYKKLLHFFQVGDYYCMIFNPPEMRVDYISPEVKKVLGYDPSEFDVDLFLNNIHPDDLPYFVDFESAVVDFKKKLPPEKVMKYKTCYSYRIRKRSGDYLTILQQSVTVQSDEDGAVLRNFVIHTDVSHLKSDTKMTLSFIGLSGEPSYLNLEPRGRYIREKELLTQREKEVLTLLAQHKTSREIAASLNISPATVGTHRKNMHAKTGTATVLQLVLLAMEKGWLCLILYFGTLYLILI